jgi:hypothetical protein
MRLFASHMTAWLVPHIEHILEIDGMLETNVFAHSDNAQPNKVLRTVQYKVSDKNSLDNYITNHAPAMRADGINKFGSKFSATRRILHHSGISLKRKE